MKNQDRLQSSFSIFHLKFEILNSGERLDPMAGGLIT